MNTVKFLLVLTTLSYVGCNSTTESTVGGDPILMASVKSDGVNYTLTIINTTFALSDTLEFTFQVWNDSDIVKEFAFANIQQVGFQLIDGSGNIDLNYPSIVFPMGSILHLEPSKTKDYKISRPFKDHNGKFISRGEYRISSYLLEGKSPKVNLRITIR